VKSIPSNISLRIALIAAICGLAPVALLAQSAPPQPPATPNAPPPLPGQPTNPAEQDSIGAPGLTGQMMRDKNFIRDAISSNLAEIQFGQLASQKAESADVKTFAQKMVADHNELNQDMNTLADTLGIMVPKKLTKEDQAEYNKLKALSPADFETRYITIVAMNHRKDLHDFREEFVATNDTNIHDAIMKTGPIMREHGQAIEKLAKDKNVQLPPRQRPTPAAQ
jgi:putative membrane protein